MAFGATAFGARSASASPLDSAHVDHVDGHADHRPEHVILIDWDGLDHRYLEWFDLPNIQGLIDRGSYAVARGVFKSISNPSRAAMATGAYPDTNGNFAYVYNPETNQVQGQSRFIAVETLTQRLASEGLNTASVGWYMVQNYGNTYGDPTHPYIQPPHPFIHRTETVIDLLNGRPVDSGGEMITLPKIPEFLGIYGNDPDALGHAEGPNSPNMGPLLRDLDGQLGAIIAETKNAGIYDKTAFILTTDHGMSAWSKAALPQAMGAIEDLGFTVERVGSNGTPADDTDVVVIAFVHTLNVHLRGDLATQANRDRLARALGALPEVEHVFNTDDLAALRANPIEDLVVETKYPYAFSHSGEDLPEGEERGSHSGVNEMQLPLIMAGPGVKQGKGMRDPSIVDITPTICELLGVRPPAQADGRVLREVLRRPGKP